MTTVSSVRADPTLGLQAKAMSESRDSVLSGLKRTSLARSRRCFPDNRGSTRAALELLRRSACGAPEDLGDRLARAEKKIQVASTMVASE